LGPALQSAGYDVIALVRHISKRDVPINFGKVINCDLTDFGMIQRKVAEYQPEIIINLAAQSLVAYSFEHTTEVAATDYVGAINLMEVARQVKHLELFLQASTSEVYGYQTIFPTKETAEKNPHCPYSIAKNAADNYAKFLGMAYRFPFFLIRNFNTYGEKDSVRRVTERTIAQMLHGDMVSLGDPDAIRDFLFVDDSISAYMAVIERRLHGLEMNICTGVGITIRDWVHKIGDIMNYKGEITFNSTYRRPTDIPILIGSNEQARKVLGWKPSNTHELGIRATIPKVAAYVERTGWTKPTGGWS
jgi:dTDP-glucose 4,6-dehydratase